MVQRKEKIWFGKLFRNIIRTSSFESTGAFCAQWDVFIDLFSAPPLLYRAALLYLGCYLASKVSFCELFQLLEKHQPDPDMRWRECVRVKRGIADTTKPGGTLYIIDRNVQRSDLLHGSHKCP